MSTSVEPATPATSLSLREQVPRVAGYVTALPRGPRATLRRLSNDPDAVPPQAFWHIVQRYGIASRDEPFWTRVIPLMVNHPHEPGTRPGVAFARAGVSAARLERWLRLDCAGARAEAGRLLSHLGDGGLDWIRFAELLHRWDHPDHGPGRRRDLARDFFLSPEYRARTATAGDNA